MMLKNYLEKDRSTMNTCVKCVAVACMYVFGHAFFSPLKYLAILSTFTLFVLDYKEIISMILFFIPMASIMKFSPSDMTFLNIAIIISVGMLIVMNKRKIGSTELFIGLSFVALLLLKNLLTGFGLPLSYIRIALLLILVPQCIKGYKEGEVTGEITKIAICAFAGIVVSATVGALFVENKVLSEFIASEDSFHFGEEIISRFCGLSSDPNYFSSLILFALALQLYCVVRYNKLLYFLNAVILSVIGVLTYSKMFFLIMVVVWAVGIINVIRVKQPTEKEKRKKKILLTISAICLAAVGVYILKSGSIDMLLSRFQGNDASSITTGRSDIWVEYLVAIFDSEKTLLFGATTNSLLVGIHVTHNTFIQILWKLGLCGFMLISIWFIYLYRIARGSFRFHKGSFLNTLVILLALTLPLLALDKFFFDELYWYFIVYLLCKTDTEKSLGEKK